MAKDDRKILSSVRLHSDRDTRKGRALFTTGMEDELAEAVSQEQLDRLAEQGAISGTWKATKAAKSDKAKEK